MNKSMNVQLRNTIDELELATLRFVDRAASFLDESICNHDLVEAQLVASTINTALINFINIRDSMLVVINNSDKSTK